MTQVNTITKSHKGTHLIYAEMKQIEAYCVLQVKSLEVCNKKFRTLPTLIFFVINDSIKHVLSDNYHQ
ncbi:hypothetical protein GCM10022410_13020 [Amphibacillus indicireducens]|uniref:Uncharacterized protein n=1 Tax=Amphibacillus indicireducens TaxID=1076330 RepID=A0ABP7VJ91_9BACI